MPTADGRVEEVPTAFMGAEGRFEDWIYLRMIEREWKRPESSDEWFESLAAGARPSAKAAIVLLFWSYFETKIERIFRHGMRYQPQTIVEDLLRRYATVGSRLERLYEIVFESTYMKDLQSFGFERLSLDLAEIKRRRNEFSHGDPAAVDDSLVKMVVENLKIEHEAWIAVFNRRAAQPITLPQRGSWDVHQ